MFTMMWSLLIGLGARDIETRSFYVEADDGTRLAVDAGYGGLCMRASQVGVRSSESELAAAARAVRDAGLRVTMATPNFDIVHNNERGPRCLRDIAPCLDVARALDAPMIRVAIKEQADIPHAQRAADAARERGVRLVHQCHTLSLFETVDGAERTLEAIGRDNFGLIYEPANLELCGQDYGRDSIRRLAPWIFNVYLQNQRVHPEGAVTLDTWTRGPARFDLISVHDPGGLDFERVFDGLRDIGYTGPVTVHQSAREGESPLDTATRTARFLRERFLADI